MADSLKLYTRRSTGRAQTSSAEADHYSYLSLAMGKGKTGMGIGAKGRVDRKEGGWEGEIATERETGR